MKKPLTTKAPAEQVVKDIRRATRKLHSSEENIRIVLSGLRGEDSIAELCRKEGIANDKTSAPSRRSGAPPPEPTCPDHAVPQPAEASKQCLPASLAFQSFYDPPKIGIILSQLVDNFSGGAPMCLKKWKSNK